MVRPSNQTNVVHQTVAVIGVVVQKIIVRVVGRVYWNNSFGSLDYSCCFHLNTAVRRVTANASTNVG